MGRYVIAPVADRDLLELFRFGVRTFGVEATSAYHDELVQVFRTVAAFPELARERTEYRPPVRIHHHGRHYIIYRALKDHVRIVRVLRDEADLRRHLRPAGRP